MAKTTKDNNTNNTSTDQNKKNSADMYDILKDIRDEIKKQNSSNKSNSSSTSNSSGSDNKKEHKALKKLYDDSMGSLGDLGLILGGPLLSGAGKAINHYFGESLKSKLFDKKGGSSSASGVGSTNNSDGKATTAKNSRSSASEWNKLEKQAAPINNLSRTVNAKLDQIIKLMGGKPKKVTEQGGESGGFLSGLLGGILGPLLGSALASGAGWLLKKLGLRKVGDWIQKKWGRGKTKAKTKSPRTPKKSTTKTTEKSTKKKATTKTASKKTASKTTAKATSKAAGKTTEKAAEKAAGKAATKAAGKAATKSVGKAAAKTGAKAVGKSLLKKIPGIGLLSGLVFGVGRALKGDWSGAALEVASGAASTIPGIGTGASIALDAALAAKDIHNATAQKSMGENITDAAQPVSEVRDFSGIGAMTAKALKEKEAENAVGSVSLANGTTYERNAKEETQAKLEKHSMETNNEYNRQNNISMANVSDQMNVVVQLLSELATSLSASTQSDLDRQYANMIMGNGYFGGNATYPQSGSGYINMSITNPMGA
jgi:hypothetical protein